MWGGGGHGGCRKVQGEHKWGNEGGRGGVEEDGCRSVLSDNSASLGGGGGGEGGGLEREQSASWGRDIGVSNKQTTDTYKYIGCTGLFLNPHNVADSRSVTTHNNTVTSKLSHLMYKIRISLAGCVCETLVNWPPIHASLCACVHMRCARDRALHCEIKVSERVTIAHAGDLWCHCSRVDG